MAIIIGSNYRKRTGDVWNTHYLRTHANAVITTSEKDFVSSAQKDFVAALMGDGSGTSGTAYGALVDKVTSLETFKQGIESLFAEGSDSTIIDQLHEIVTFVRGASVAEGLDLEDFINSLNKISINGVATAGQTVSIYAPTSTGTSGQVLISTGSSTKIPAWSNELNLSGKIKGDSAEFGETKINSNGQIQAASGMVPKISGSGDIGSSALPFRNFYGETLIANGKDILNMKNAVEKTTEPDAADYGRNSMIDGLVWIDTGTVAPAPSTWRHVLKIRVAKKLYAPLPNTDDFAVINNVLKNIKLYSVSGSLHFFPFIEFDCGGKPWAIGIQRDFSHASIDDTYDYYITLRKTVNSIYDTQVMFGSSGVLTSLLNWSWNWNNDTATNVSFGSFSEVEIDDDTALPNAYIVSNNLYLLLCGTDGLGRQLMSFLDIQIFPEWYLE